MKLLSTAALLAATVAATPASAQAFAGPHLGAFVGINAQNSQFQDYWCDVACDAPAMKGVDLAAGLTAGYDVQIDENFVVGIEGDIGLGGKDSQTNVDSDATYGGEGTYDLNVKRLATLRARAGLAMGNTMVYATGGLANAKVRYSANWTYTGSESTNWDDYFARGSQSMTGYVLGGGIEHSFGAWSMKAELLHTDLGKSDRACFKDVGASVCWNDEATDEDNISVSPVMNSIRIGFNYNF